MFYNVGEMKTEGPANIRLSKELKERIVAFAKRNEISVSDVVRLAIVTELPLMESGAFMLKAAAQGVKQ